jgi:hypothetical protein
VQTLDGNALQAFGELKTLINSIQWLVQIRMEGTGKLKAELNDFNFKL